MPSVLLADDDLVIRQSYAAQLTSEGFAVRVARDGKEALDLIGRELPDLLIVDLDMPKVSGFAVCEAFRRKDPTRPVVVLTAHATPVNELRSLGLGADAVVDKDAGPQVVLAHVRRALSRQEAFEARADEGLSSTFNLPEMRIDFDAGVVRVRDRVVHLTPTETDILRVLAANRGRYVSVSDLVTAIRGEGYACADGVVYSPLSRLRRKLGACAGCIQSNRVYGYRLA